MTAYWGEKICGKGFCGGWRTMSGLAEEDASKFQEVVDGETS